MPRLPISLPRHALLRGTAPRVVVRAVRTLCAPAAAAVLGLSLSVGCATAPATKPAQAQANVAPMTIAIGAPTGTAAADQVAASLQAGLQKHLGRPVSVRVLEPGAPLVAALTSGEVAFAWLPPFPYVRAAGQAAITPIRKVRRSGETTYKAVIFTREDAGYVSPADLKGKTVGWVNANSSSGYLYPMALLLSAGLKPDAHFGQQRFLGDHLAVCEAVANGDVDAGATFTNDLESGTPKNVTACRTILKGVKLRVLSATDAMPNDAIVAGPAVSKADQGDLGRALDALSRDAGAMKVLTSLEWADGFAPVEGAEYAPVRAAAELLDGQAPAAP